MVRANVVNERQSVSRIRQSSAAVGVSLAVAASGGARVSGAGGQMSYLSPLPWLQPPSFGALSLWRPGAIAPS
jgi:hypothetical protein